MNLVNMLLNPRSSDVTTRASRARFSPGPGPSTRFSSAEFSRVLDHKISDDVGLESVEREVKLQEQAVEIQDRSSSDYAQNIEEMLGTSQGNRGDVERFLNGSESENQQNEFLRQVSPNRDERGITREKNRNSFDQESNRNSSEQSQQQVIRELVKDEFGGKRTSRTLENLSEQQKEIVEKIKNGEFDFSNKDDLEKLKELLERFSESDSGALKEEGLSLLNKLFSSDEFLKAFDQENVSTEQLQQNLKSLQELLEQTRNLLDQFTNSVNEAVVERLEKGFEKLKNSGNNNGGAQSLTKLLESIRQALKKEGASGSEQIKQISQAVEQAEKLAQQLEKQLSDGKRPNDSQQSNLVKQLKNLAKQLNKAFNSNTKEGGADNQPSRETLKQFQQALKTAETVVEGSDQKEKLADRLRKLQARNTQSSSSQNGTDSSNTTTEGQSGETKTDSSEPKASNSTSEQTNTREATRQQNQGQKSSNSQTQSIENNQTQAQNQSTDTGGESESSKQSSSAENSNSERLQTNQESKNREGAEEKKAQSDRRNNNGETKDSKNQGSQPADRNTSAKQASPSASGEAGASQSQPTPDSVRPNPNQVASYSVREAEHSQETARIRGDSTSSSGSEKPDPSKLKSLFSESIEKVKSQDNSDAQKFQVIDADNLKQNAQGEKKNSGKLAQYEVNAARTPTGSEGSDAQFSQSGQQQQNSSFRGNATSQAFRGSNFSQRMMEARQVIDQMVERAQTMVDEGKQTMKVQLQPAVLGEMKMSVSLEDDQVKAKVQVEKQSVKALLDENMKDLKLAMDNIGVELDQVDISESDDGESGSDFWFDEETELAGRGAQDAKEDGEEAEEHLTRGHINPTREYSSIELVA